MLYRVSQSVKNYEEPDLIGGFEKEIQDGDISENVEKAEKDFTPVAYYRVDNSYNQLLTNDFNAVEDVYKNIRTGDRVIFLVRHSERINDCTSEWWLTEYWVELAQWVWMKLQWTPFEDSSTDFYWSSAVKRTVQTSYYVGESRGSKVLKNEIDSDNWSDYEFVNHSDDMNSIIYWEYFTDWNS